MKTKIGGTALASAGVGLLLVLWQYGPRAESNQADSDDELVSKNVGSGQASKLAQAGNHPVIPRPLPFPSVKTTDPVIETTSRLGSPDADVEDDIGILGVLLESYRRSLGSVPTGMNDQVVAALQGENLRGLAVFPSKHAALSPEGELLDRWGTPYWFHAQSSKLMTIISAGPDKQFGTPDDVAPLGDDGAGDFAHEG